MEITEEYARENLYARKCDITGKGMNEGFLDVDSYYSTMEALIEGNRKTNPNYTEEDWVKDCKENEDECYYTEWCPVGDGWDFLFTADGEEVPNPFYDM